MKRNFFITNTLCVMLMALVSACKQNNVIPNNSSINVIDASPDVPGMTVNFTLTPVPFYEFNSPYGPGSQTLLNYGAASNYGEPSGSIPLTLVSSSDTTHHFYQSTLDLAPGKIYSLYVFGTLPTINTLLHQDDIPVHKDSVSGARFINLSPDAGAITISLPGNTSDEFSNLAYKSITEFKSYSNTSVIMNNGGYNFQVTNAGGTVLATFNWNPQEFQNNTLVFSGNSSAGYEIFQVNNY